jgi:hypothetical protein
MDAEPATIVTAADARIEHRLRLAEGALITLAEWQGNGQTGPLPDVLESRNGLAALHAIIEQVAAARTASGYPARLVELKTAHLHTAAQALVLMLDPAGPLDLAEAVAISAESDNTTPDQLAVDAWHALTMLGRPVITTADWSSGAA